MFSFVPQKTNPKYDHDGKRGGRLRGGKVGSKKGGRKQGEPQKQSDSFSQNIGPDDINKFEDKYGVDGRYNEIPLNAMYQDNSPQKYPQS